MAALKYGTYRPALRLVSKESETYGSQFVLALSSHVNLEFLDPKQFLEVLEGSEELLSCIFLGFRPRGANGEASPNWLIHPN